MMASSMARSGARSTAFAGSSFGDSYQFSESDLLDWLITHPDGSEEGNFVGKFLDSYGSNGT